MYTYIYIYICIHIYIITQRLEAKRDPEYKMADTIQVNIIYR